MPFSTAVAEQLHASAALVSRHHPEYGLGTLQGRAMVLTARKLLPVQTKAQKLVAKLEARLQKMDRRVPSELCGRQVFFRDVSKAVARRRSETVGRAKKTLQQRLMKHHVTLHNGLSEVVRKRCAVLATTEATGKEREIVSQRSRMIEELSRSIETVRQERLTKLRVDFFLVFNGVWLRIYRHPIGKQGLPS